jgi:hypothetical protein
VERHVDAHIPRDPLERRLRGRFAWLALVAELSFRGGADASMVTRTA